MRMPRCACVCLTSAYPLQCRLHCFTSFSTRPSLRLANGCLPPACFIANLSYAAAHLLSFPLPLSSAPPRRQDSIIDSEPEMRMGWYVLRFLKCARACVQSLIHALARARYLQDLSLAISATCRNPFPHEFCKLISSMQDLPRACKNSNILDTGTVAKFDIGAIGECGHAAGVAEHRHAAGNPSWLRV